MPSQPTILISRALPALAPLTLPVWAVLGLLVALEQLSLSAALLAGLAASAGLAILVLRRQASLAAIVAHARLPLAKSGTTAAPPEGNALAEPELMHAIDRLRLDAAAEIRRLRERLAEGNAILDSLPDPLLLLDRGRVVVRCNRAASALLGENLAGRDLAAVLRHPALLEAVDAVLRGEGRSRQLEFPLLYPVARDFSARALALPRSAEREGAELLLWLHDLTSVKRLEQTRVDFVANASHELRTPLSTLIGFIETLQGPARDDAEARARFLAIMHEQAGRMARLIGDLLSLSRIELNEHSAPEGRVDLGEAIGSVIDMLQVQVAAKDMRIELEAPERLPPAIGQRDELVQVFQNLIDNAVKYGRPGTAVTVTVTPPARPGGNLSVAVRDRGEGIPRHHLPRLTERFYRVDSARSRALGGTGLGLAIVKHIVNRHRGSLGIDSTLGKGSTFTVSLPAAAPEPGADRV